MINNMFADTLSYKNIIRNYRTKFWCFASVFFIVFCVFAKLVLCIKVCSFFASVQCYMHDCMSGDK